MLRAIREKAIADYRAKETESIQRLASIFAEAFTPTSDAVITRLDKIEEAIKLLLERELDDWASMPIDQGATLEELIKVVQSSNRRDRVKSKEENRKE